jgi:hypothetical protein
MKKFPEFVLMIPHKLKSFNLTLKRTHPTLAERSPFCGEAAK